MIKEMLSVLGAKILWRFERHPLVIIYIDGGFTSQMIRAAFGKMLEKKGFNVRYDRSFYKKSGYDMCHLEKRRYLLDVCFPDVVIPEPKKITLNRYKLFYDYESGRYDELDRIEMMDFKKPIFFSGYSSDNLINEEECARFFSLDHISKILGEPARDYDRIIRDNINNGIINVGIHVRRGDMTLTGFYWKVLTGSYFLEAVRRIKEEYKGHRLSFFFFSNGFDFVNEEIIPGIKDEKVMLVDDCNEEYEDFYLLSKCDIQVESQGSWGRIAYFFNNNPKKKLVTYKASSLKDQNVLHVELRKEMYL